MPDHYSPSLFLQQIPNKLLKEYFTRRGEPIDLDWDSLTEGDVLPILDAWHGLSLPQQADIEHWFRTISSLATKDGLKTVIEECKFHELELPEVFNNIPGIHEKVFWIFLQKENVILSAGRLNRADHLYSRYWRRRIDLPAKKPDLDHPTRKELGRVHNKRTFL